MDDAVILNSVASTVSNVLFEVTIFGMTALSPFWAMFSVFEYIVGDIGCTADWISSLVFLVVIIGAIIAGGFSFYYNIFRRKIRPVPLRLQPVVSNLKAGLASLMASYSLLFFGLTIFDSTDNYIYLIWAILTGVLGIGVYLLLTYLFLNLEEPDEEGEESVSVIVVDKCKCAIFSCPICLYCPCTISANSRRLVVLQCGHIICSRCANQLLKLQGSIICPNCRQRTKKKDLRAVFF